MSEVSIAGKQQAVSQSSLLTAATQLQRWGASDEGAHLWKTAGLLLSVERVCHALDITHAGIYGLLITPHFFTIFSTFHPQSFTRLAERYQAAARMGLCFWWDGSTLHRCVHSDAFFALLQTLPPPHRPSVLHSRSIKGAL